MSKTKIYNHILTTLPGVNFEPHDDCVDGAHAGIVRLLCLKMQAQLYNKMNWGNDWVAL